MRYCGRNFSTAELTAIRNLIKDNPAFNRAQLSRIVCDIFNWRLRNGNLKDMSCRVAMLRMQDDGLIQLPTPLTAITTASRIDAAHNRQNQNFNRIETQRWLTH